MYAIYGHIYHQYTPFMLASIYHTWILWDIVWPEPLFFWANVEPWPTAHYWLVVFWSFHGSSQSFHWGSKHQLEAGLNVHGRCGTAWWRPLPPYGKMSFFFFAASYIILEKMVHSFFWNMGRIISRYILLKSGKRWIQYSRNLEHWESDLGLPCGEKLSGGLFWFLPGLDCRVWVDY